VKHPGDVRPVRKAPIRFRLTQVDEADPFPLKPLFSAEKDSVVSPESVNKAALKVKNSEVVSLAMGHFDVYFGEHFEEATRRQVEFLKKHLVRTV
jgi:fermentation-respiration switch protein FrsA (DUF1100 family)